MTTIPHISRNRILFGTGLVLVLVLILVFVPFRIPRNATVYGRVLAQREWVLVRGAGGQLQALLRGNETGAVEEYAVAEPLRGDAMQFVLAPGAAGGGSVNAGDTLGWVISPELERQLAALEGTLDVARAALASARTGEKPALVAQSRALLAQARALYEEHRHVHARQQELHEKKILSDQEYQISLDRLDVLQAGVDASEAQLAAMSTGLKAEDVAQRERAVAALDAEVAALRLRLRSHTYVAPIAGALRGGFSEDTLLALQEEGRMLLLPLSVDDRGRIRSDEPIPFSVPGTGLRGKAQVQFVRNDLQYLQGHPMCFVVARVGGKGVLQPGLIVRADVPCHALSPGEYLERLWHDMFH
ncbi:MAG: hypothetical protein KFF77_11760 [Bacteroidetes bacterium]|nr:hypothetical protein [Bacteroidota bacterium]